MAVCGLERWLGPGQVTGPNPTAENFALELAIPFTPLCQCLSAETKSCRSLQSGVYHARGSKRSHQSTLECHV